MKHLLDTTFCSLRKNSTAVMIMDVDTHDATVLLEKKGPKKV